jgi:hypothetical protein
MSVSVELNVEFKVRQGYGACRMSEPELFHFREKDGQAYPLPGKDLPGIYAAAAFGADSWREQAITSCTDEN